MKNHSEKKQNLLKIEILLKLYIYEFIRLDLN